MDEQLKFLIWYQFCKFARTFNKIHLKLLMFPNILSFVYNEDWSFISFFDRRDIIFVGRHRVKPRLHQVYQVQRFIDFFYVQNQSLEPNLSTKLTPPELFSWFPSHRYRKFLWENQFNLRQPTIFSLYSLISLWISSTTTSTARRYTPNRCRCCNPMQKSDTSKLKFLISRMSIL